MEDQDTKDNSVHLAKCLVYKRRHPGRQNGNLPSLLLAGAREVFPKHHMIENQLALCREVLRH